MNTHSLADGLVFPMHRGPFQNNGASPWYTPLAVGTPPQPLKLAIDTGTHITWVSSTLCPPDQCQHFAGNRFDYLASRTFAFRDRTQHPFSFGPWGTMQVESGADVVTMPNGAALEMELFLAAHYAGKQFRQLDWDGGIGLPSSAPDLESHPSLLFQALLENGQINPDQPYVSFDWDPLTRRGSCRMGAVEASKIQGPHVFLPWSPYLAQPGMEYIWSTELNSYSVNGETLATDISFALDSGSSRFKGDDRLMRQTLERITHGGDSQLVLGFADGEITLGPDQYNALIEEGPEHGQTRPQFEPIGLPDLVLVGSLVMEHCYTVYEYRVVAGRSHGYSLEPVGIWLFNRPDGPRIISRSSSRRFTPGLPAKQPIPPDSAGSVAGTWKNDYGSMMTLSVSGNRVSGLYQSSTGATGTYEVSGFQLGTDPAHNLGRPVALAIGWQTIDKTPAVPSRNWSSGLCGQISVIGTEEVLTLSHLLVASSDFPGVFNLGNYIDKLVYRRSPPLTNATATVVVPRRSTTKNPLNGIWKAEDGTRLKLTVDAAGPDLPGRVHGYLSTAQGQTEVCGFTDINASASDLTLQSVSINAVQASSVMSLCGALNLKDDVLNLLILTSAPTPPTQTYVQTQIAPIAFKRKPR